MHEAFLFGQFDFAFILRDVDIPVVPVGETIEEIEAAESGEAPFDTGLRVDVGNELPSVLLLVFRRVEGVDKFDPEIGFDGFAGDDKLRAYLTTQQHIIFVFLQEVHAVRTHIQLHSFTQVNLRILEGVGTRSGEEQTVAYPLVRVGFLGSRPCAVRSDDAQGITYVQLEVVDGFVTEIDGGVGLAEVGSDGGVIEVKTQIFRYPQPETVPPFLIEPRSEAQLCRLHLCGCLGSVLPGVRLGGIQNTEYRTQTYNE